MKQRLLSDYIEEIGRMSDFTLRLSYATSLIRATLAQAAYATIEYIDIQGRIDEYPVVIDNVRRLLVPNDGDLVAAFDDLLPVLHNIGWQGVVISWFQASIDETGTSQPPLRDALRKWVAFRNDTLGHGVVSEHTVNEALLWVLPLLHRVVAGFGPLLPFPGSDDTLELAGSGKAQTRWGRGEGQGEQGICVCID